jgi:hypothetical protein
VSGPPVERSTGDVVATVLLLLVHAVACLVTSFLSVGLVFFSDSCGSAGPCSTGLIAAGFVLGLVGPWVVWLAATVVAIVRLVRGRRAWWVPLLGVLGSGAVFALAFVLAYVGAA